MPDVVGGKAMLQRSVKRAVNSVVEYGAIYAIGAGSIPALPFFLFPLFLCLGFIFLVKILIILRKRNLIASLSCFRFCFVFYDVE